MKYTIIKSVAGEASEIISQTSSKDGFAKSYGYRKSRRSTGEKIRQEGLPSGLPYQ